MADPNSARLKDLDWFKKKVAANSYSTFKNALVSMYTHLTKDKYAEARQILYDHGLGKKKDKKETEVGAELGAVSKTILTVYKKNPDLDYTQIAEKAGTTKDYVRKVIRRNATKKKLTPKKTKRVRLTKATKAEERIVRITAEVAFAKAVRAIGIERAKQMLTLLDAYLQTA